MDTNQIDTTGIQSKTEKFFSGYQTKELKKGTKLIFPGEEAPFIYYVKNGYVRMSQMIADGKELTVNIFIPGTYFPFFLSFFAVENQYCYQTISSVAVSAAPVSDVMEFARGNVDVLWDFTRRMSAGIHGLLQSLPYQLYGTVHKRIVSTIHMLSLRCGEDTADGIRIAFPITHQDIADFTGTARETASLEMEKLQKQRIISYAHKTLVIRNLSRLKQESMLH